MVEVHQLPGAKQLGLAWLEKDAVRQLRKPR